MAFNQQLAGAIPGARYVEIENAGHGVTIHRAGDINALLAEHWAAAEASRYPTSTSNPPTIPATRL